MKILQAFTIRIGDKIGLVTQIGKVEKEIWAVQEDFVVETVIVNPKIAVLNVQGRVDVYILDIVADALIAFVLPVAQILASPQNYEQFPHFYHFLNHLRESIVIRNQLFHVFEVAQIGNFDSLLRQSQAVQLLSNEVRCLCSPTPLSRSPVFPASDNHHIGLTPIGISTFKVHFRTVPEFGLVQGVSFLGKLLMERIEVKGNIGHGQRLISKCYNFAVKYTKGMILLSGATGFLGGYIYRELTNSGYSVRALVRNPEKAARLLPADADIAQGDILDIYSLEKALEGCDQVIHAAAMVSFWKKRRDKMREINSHGTANVVDACLDAKVKKLVYVSSVAALGRAVNGSTINGHTKWKDSKYNSYYGKTKYLGEKEVHRGIQEGLPAVICNPGIIVGPGNWEENSPKLFKMMYKGMKWSPSGTTGFVPAIDVARAVRLLLESNFENGERFPLVAESLPYKEYFGKISHAVGKKSGKKTLPLFLTKLFGRISEIKAGITGKEPLITRETVQQSSGQFFYDSTRIEKELDFTFSSLDEVIASTGAQFLKEYAAKS